MYASYDERTYASYDERTYASYDERTYCTPVMCGKKQKQTLDVELHGGFRSQCLFLSEIFKAHFF